MRRRFCRGLILALLGLLSIRAGESPVAPGDLDYRSDRGHPRADGGAAAGAPGFSLR